MSDILKATIIAGEGKDSEFAVEFVTTVLVGRSRSAAIRIQDADVSGKHFEFVRSADGCCVRDLSRNGLKIDGKLLGEGETGTVRVGSVVEVGAEAKLRIDSLPAFGGQEPGDASERPEEVLPSRGADFFEADERTTNGGTSDPVAARSGVTGPSPADESTTHPSQEEKTLGDDAVTDAITEAGDDGETQEMRTRVGSMEEIYARKLQLDRASVVRRWKFTVAIVLVLLFLGAVWLVTGSQHHVSDADDPVLSDGKSDTLVWWVCNPAGEPELMIEYPRCDQMRVSPSSDSNTVDIVSALGVEADIPFHLEFKRWTDLDDIQHSLEDSFARRLQKDSEVGMSFERQGKGGLKGEFFENVFPGFCEWKSPRGVRFMRSEFTRSVKNELWHGVVLYLRRGATIYQLRTEIPDVFWKRGGYRLTDEPHLGVYRRFAANHWDSPGRAGLVSDAFSDDYLLKCIKRELSVERVSSWPMLEAYFDTILVRTWDTKPVIQEKTLMYYQTFLDKMQRFYNERELAFRNAQLNGDDKRTKEIFLDAQAVFGAMPRDRRSTMVDDPEVWSCQ